MNKTEVYFKNEKVKSINSIALFLEQEKYIYKIKKLTENEYNKKASN